MKKLFLLSITLIGFSFVSNAQNLSKHAIGLRFGDNDGFGVDISYQHALGETNRLEIDLGRRSGIGYDGFKLAGLYQWIWVIDGPFNWYAGVGGGIGSNKYGKGYAYGNKHKNPYYNPYLGYEHKETFILATGNIGIEYNFDIPLQLSLDGRPELYFGDERDGLGFDVALGVRYKF